MKPIQSAGVVAVTFCVLLVPLACRTVQKVTGTQEAFLQATPDRVVAAAEAALNELELTVVSSHASKVDGRITARTAADKSITVKVKRESDTTSRMTVKIGVVGDKPISEAIISETRKRLE